MTIKWILFRLGSSNLICMCTSMSFSYTITLRSLGQRSRSPWPVIDKTEIDYKMEMLLYRVLKLYVYMHLHKFILLTCIEVTRSGSPWPVINKTIFFGHKMDTLPPTCMVFKLHMYMHLYEFCLCMYLHSIFESLCQRSRSKWPVIAKTVVNLKMETLSPGVFKLHLYAHLYRLYLHVHSNIDVTWSNVKVTMTCSRKTWNWPWNGNAFT